MGGKQSKGGKKSFVDRIFKRNRVTPIRRQHSEDSTRHNNSNDPSYSQPTHLSPTVKGTLWNDIVIEDLEDVPTDAQYDNVNATARGPIYPSITKTTETEDLNLIGRPCSILGDLVLEDLEYPLSASVYNLDNVGLSGLSSPVSGCVSAAEYDLCRRQTLQWDTDLDELYSFSFSDSSSTVEDPSSDEDLSDPIPCARIAVGEPDYVSLLRRPRERKTSDDDDSLTNVTSLDSMSIDSDLISILEGLGCLGEGNKRARVAVGEPDYISLKPTVMRTTDDDDDSLTNISSLDSMSIDSDLISIPRGLGEEDMTDGEALTSSPPLDEDGLGLDELELMFTTKEVEMEESMDKIPDYILFMSLPSIDDNMYY